MLEHVIVEGRYAQPTTPERMLAGDQAQRWCFDIYRSHPVTHFLDLAGIGVLCVFRAPDAESVRRALAKIDVLPPERVWTASLEGTDDDMTSLGRKAHEATLAGALVLVERQFADPVAFADIQAVENEGSWCLDQHHVHFLGTLFARDKKRMVCLYAAPDAETVRLTNTRLKLRFERAWAARVFGPATGQAAA